VELHEFKEVYEQKYAHAHIECSCGWKSFTTNHAPAGLSESGMRDACLEHLLRENNKLLQASVFGVKAGTMRDHFSPAHFVHFATPEFNPQDSGG
jgi:hypothetical protein